ncbi:beta-ketoacyl-[acyl-carrier-protein] synthase II [Mycobacterium dioxanotrophicus]|uniref:Beta-ketoacyl-[acyl-carrier-protein] synthase II n=1 Tax=Mycobacterium dioxanotrophicus TaxID=482462 RepID=A0A1Y0CDX1_9MYCO|nr:KasA/KasB family beta-ketoacyl-ACP synthase [Mycobacterium dioxanotrophicus]ART73458.1 beta-ketoacyl-[acyl-carrier-protein] synthase II [Mycobacterium dioxanotrophicus]
MGAKTTGDGLTDVVVTAAVSTTALAAEAEETWQLLLEGRTGIRDLDRPFVTEFDSPVRIGGQLTENIESLLSRVERKRLSYTGQMATVLGRRLWESAGAPDVDTRRLLVSIGLALGSTEELTLQYDTWLQKGLRAVPPTAIPKYMPNGAAAAVGLERQAKAGVISPLMADASGASAIAHAWRHIIFGDADVAICGGVESWIEAVPVAAFCQLGMLSTYNQDPSAACRPFDADRDGMVFGEGGALMLIETEEHAKARGAPVLARLMGVGITCDCYDAVELDPEGERAGAAISRAIELAGLTPADIDHVNAHATGTVAGDQAEAHAIHRALGAQTPAVYAPKAALGHSLGAAGAVEAVLTVQALRDGVIPPTLNHKNHDPEINLDVVADQPRRGRFHYAISDSFGFGGNNVALAFGAY